MPLRPWSSRLAGGLIAVLLIGGTAGCAGEEAIPIDPGNQPATDDSGSPGATTNGDVEPVPPNVTHSIEPTAQMQELARQQCVDDPGRDEGFVQAVDPATGQVLSEFSVDCDEVRAGG